MVNCQPESDHKQDCFTDTNTFGVNGLVVIKTDYRPKQNSDIGYGSVYQVSATNGLTVSLNFIAFPPETIENNRKIIDQILSVFKFL